jgi:hypothetical protein
MTNQTYLDLNKSNLLKNVITYSLIEAQYDSTLGTYSLNAPRCSLTELLMSNVRLNHMKGPRLELEHRPLPCPRVKSSAIAKAGGVGELVEHVNVLKPSGLYRHCQGMTFVKDAIGILKHYGRQPSDRCTRLL